MPLYHGGKLSNINDTFKRVIGILVNGHIPTGILMRLARTILVQISVGVCPFTRNPITRLNVSFMLQNFLQRKAWGTTGVARNFI